MKAFEYVDVKTVDEAIGALPPGGTMDVQRKVILKAGGIDLIDQLKERTIEPARLVNLSTVGDDLRYIRADGDAIRIGPLTTMAEVGKSSLLRERFPALADSAVKAATPQIRNVATVGGNICQRPRCWYFRANEFHCLKKGGDICFAKDTERGENQYHSIFGTDGPSMIVHPSNLGPALVAANAAIKVQGSQGERTIQAGDFFPMPEDRIEAEHNLRSDEVITEIVIPGGIRRSAYYDVREKQSHDWPLVAVAAVLLEDGWKVVMGAVAPIPWRAAKAEELLGGQGITEALATEAGEAATSGASPLTYNGYKVDLVKVAVRRALMKAAGMEVPA